jgi:phosphopantetheinyl transferase (holo-ACP synthase)
LSHAGDFCIIAGGFVCEPGNSACESESLKIGTDVMKIDIAQSRVNNPLDDEETLFEKELGKHERIINSKFSSLEKAYIYNRPNPVEKLTAFYRLWCLKESYVKCLGDGMSFDLRRVECVINSELFIDLNLRKYLIALDTQLFIDSKLVKNCKFYEQYYMNNFQTQEKSHLHIMTVCVIEKAEKMSNAEKLKDRLKLGGSSSSSSISSIATSSSSSNSSSGSGFEMEFVQVTIQDLLANLVPLEKIDFEDAQKCQPFEEEWTKFCQKADKPF